jgi:branched-chain amino acid transport system substrate-binding protein
MKRRMLMTLRVVLAILVFVSIPAVPSADQHPIKIGLLYSFSGLTVVSPRDTVLGHEIAAEEINTQGGVLGRKIVYVVRDDRLQPGEAVKEFRRLISREQVDFVMGGLSSDVALAVSQVAKEMQVLFVNTLAPAPALTEDYGHEYVIRLNTNGTAMARTAALAAAKGPWKTYYFLGPAYDWGAGVNADFWEFLQRQKTGLEKLGELLQNKGDRNFSSHITTILQANPDAVFCSIWGDDLIAFIQQANRHGFFEKVQVIATGAGDLEILRPMGAAMPDGILATFLYAFDWHPVREQENQRFVTKFVNRAGYEPTSSDVIGYISTHIVAEAIRKASSTQSASLLRALRGAQFATLLGDVLVRDFDGQATFDYNVGLTYTELNSPFKRLEELTRGKSDEILKSQQEVEQVRQIRQTRRR